MKRFAHLLLFCIFFLAMSAWMYVALHPGGRALLGLHWSIPGGIICLLFSVGCLLQALRR